MKFSRIVATLLLVFCARAMGQTSFWTTATTPGTPQVTNDSASVTLGLRFYSEVPGTVTGVRFYKGLRNTGTHVGYLWSSTGTKLAEVLFSAETASGWQQANFSPAVSITANTTYVISYLAPNGYYAQDLSFPWPTLTSSPLRTAGTSPGVFAYGSSGRFPNGTWNGSNYWVDVVFTPASALPPSTTSRTFWTNSTLPATTQATDTSSVSLGLKFYSEVAGSVTGVRFYKGSSNTGTHVGNLWSSTGTKLASVTFSNETASGWQQANFSTPVTIAANTPYVISYFAPRGYYALNQYYSWSTVNASPLRVYGTSPGVFAYGSSARLPSNTWRSSNYWVDVVFVPSTSTPLPSTYRISGTITPATAGAGATVSLSGASTATVMADSTGNYSFANLPSGTYTVTPTKTGVTYTPVSRTVTINGSNVIASFTSSSVQTWSISGRVTGSAAEVTLSGSALASATTDSAGNFIFPGLLNGSYVVAPSRSGYTFTPATASVTINSAPVSGVNFTAVAVPPRVILSWTPSITLTVTGYYLYRSATSGGPYTRLNASPVPGSTYQDSNVVRGQSYYYVATAVDGNNNESTYSAQAAATVPAQ